MIRSYCPEDIPLIWQDVRMYIQKALDRGSYLTIEDVYTNLVDSRMQLYTWESPELDAVVTTGIFEGDCYIITAAGKNYKSWIPAIASIERWAKDIGCKSIIIQGRKGWSRVLGYGITGRDSLNLHIMRKDL